MPLDSQPPRDFGLGTWSMEPEMFERSMSIVAVVIIDGIVAEKGELAAFVGDELRGVARPASYKAPVG